MGNARLPHRHHRRVVLHAFAGELMGGSKTDQALKSGLGSLLGFLLGTVVKCVMCAYFCWEFVKALV